MTLWSDFFSTDYGLLSAVTLGIILLMGGCFVWYFRKQYKEDCARHEREAKG